MGNWGLSAADLIELERLGIIAAPEPPPVQLPAGISEKEFQQVVIELAHGFGWKVAHFRKARTLKGWRTAVAADGCGFPDLILVRDRVIFAELKSEHGRLDPPQTNWRDWLGTAGSEWYQWRPMNLPEIEEILK